MKSDPAALAWQKAYYRRPGMAEVYKANTRKWNAANPFRYLASQLKARAKKRGTPYDLDWEYLSSLMPADGLCPVLRVRLVLPGERPPAGNKGPRDDDISVDRCNPSRGYVRGNVALLSVKANRMKNDCTDPEAFIRLAEHVRKHCS